MMNRILRILLLALVAAACFPFGARAQFKEEAFTQNYSDHVDTTGRDTTDKSFSFKEYFGGLSHKREARIGVVFAGSTVFIGGQQIYNRQYWKLPIIYGGMATTAGLGIYYRHEYNVHHRPQDKTTSTIMFVGTGLVWWGSMMDGVGNYNRGVKGQAGKATLYSVLLPGLGQVYNGEYWKVPIYYAGLLGSTHFVMTNNINYQRYKRIHNEATAPEGDYTGPISAQTALYYRNIYRRYRDYSIVALAAFYLLQVIDANVFAYMQDFDLSDDIAMKVSPAVIDTSLQLDAAVDEGLRPGVNTSLMYSHGPSGFGIKVGFRF